MEKKIVINGTTYTESKDSNYKAVELINEFIQKFIEEQKIKEEKPKK